MLIVLAFDFEECEHAVWFGTLARTQGTKRFTYRAVLTGLMANYRFRAFANSSCRVQLNVNNAFNAERVFVTRTFANGVARNYGRQAGREFILSVDVER